MKRHEQYDVIIIGAGIIGLATAFYSTRAGLKTLIVERDSAGSGTTSAAAGMLGVQVELQSRTPLYPLAKESRKLYEQLQPALMEKTGTSLSRTVSGAIKPSFSSEEWEKLKQIEQWQADAGEAVQRWAVEELYERVPSLAAGAEGALYFPEEAHVEPAQAARAFQQAATLQGAELKTHTEVLSLIQDGESCQGIRTTTGETFYGEHVVIATGPDPFIGAAHENLLPINGIKGEAVRVQAYRPLVTKTLYHDHFYFVPKPNGETLIGATSQPSRERTTTVQGIGEVLRHAQRLVPEVANATITKMWAGVRPQTSDDLPLLGPHPTIRGCWLNSGHGRNGILLAPASGKEIVAAIMTGNTEALTAFAPGRPATKEVSTLEYHR
ncbi:glycine oxidase ThiO [Natribacillus halophilus]|uniref:glycine oxidase n=1 Tax=Natribacillus halophilus TaxID=549003 RepID=A0A1G8QAA1_9BACI|nr:glycine oxidase ThiO [Natribacillus halophilus]SDJ01714.1 glycine oxidase [Natribacillus halophilus]